MKYFFNLKIHILLVLLCVSCHTHDRRDYDKKVIKNTDNQPNEIIIEIDTDKYYTVKKIIDGDTFWIDDNSPKGQKIRLIGIDAPETRNVFKKKKSPFGETSKRFLEDLIGNQKVRLVFDVGKKDLYNRWLAYAYLEDGMFINGTMIKNGMAVVMTIPPNVKFVDEFINLQKSARDRKLGVWSDDLHFKFD